MTIPSAPLRVGRPRWLAGSLLCLASIAAAGPLLAASVSVPVRVEVGAEIEVSWSGPGGGQDFISLDPAGAPEREYGPYAYARSGNPATLRAPGTPGSFVVRYHSGDSGYPVLASAPVEVVAATATVRVPAAVAVGAAVSIDWQGPDNRQDFLSIDEADAPDSKYGSYAYTAKGSPLTIPAPAKPGRYLVRYHLGVSGYPVIGSAPLSVGEVSATVSAPARGAAGSTVEVVWTGPDNPQDFLSLDPVGAPDGEYGHYVYTAKGSPIEMPLPEVPGRYLIRYHLGAGGYRVIGSTAIEVGGVSASVEPRGPAVAGEPFEVAWSGPDNELDFITVVAVGTAERDYGHYAYTRRGNPVRLEAPRSPGTYEVRYLTGRESRLLAKAPLEVRPGVARGRLRVTAGDSAVGATGAGAVEVILDASGSMLQRLGGTRRIELARTALLELTGEALPPGVPFAMRVFGHREADSCRTDLEIPLAPLDRARVATRIRGIEAMNLAKTPIADSLRKVRQDLAAASGPRIVVLVTDGEETCGGDPAAAIRELAAAGIDARVSIVGFAIDELMLEEQFAEWARLGGGRYLDARSGDALRQAVRDAVQPTFEVLAKGQVVARGAVGGEPLELTVGEYQVRLGSGIDLGSVAIRAAAESVVAAGD